MQGSDIFKYFVGGVYGRKDFECLEVLYVRFLCLPKMGMFEGKVSLILISRVKWSYND